MTPPTPASTPSAPSPPAPNEQTAAQHGDHAVSTNDGTDVAQGTTQPLSPEMAEAPTQPAVLDPGADIDGYRVIELREERPDVRVYRAQAPADLCLQCGTRRSDPNARFCETCGAELLPRDVLLLEPTGDIPAHGPWLALALPDDPRRALLPPLTPLQHDAQQLLAVEETIPGWQSLAELLISHGTTPEQPAALEDDDALLIARQLTQMLQYLHANQIALGELSLPHLLIGPQGRLRLRDVDDLQPLTPETQQGDLQRLQHTLEEITRRPRTTQRLDDTLPEIDSPRSLHDVLALARANKLPDADAWAVALDVVEHHQRAIQPLRTTVAARSDVGQVRELNEDALLALQLDSDMAGRTVNAGVYVVADGMGGHEAGEIASSLAVHSMASVAAPALLELVAGDQGVDLDDLRTIAARAAQHANETVFLTGRQRGNDMGTTLTFALVVGDRCVVGNVGDSRTYLLRDGQLQRVTTDHSLVQRLVDMGQIAPDDVYTHPHRNAILRSLGEQMEVDIDLFDLRLQPGDALLCCSDGLWEMVRDDRLKSIMLDADVHSAVDQMIDEANRNGGEDNISAVLIRFAAHTTTHTNTDGIQEEETDV